MDWDSRQKKPQGVKKKEKKHKVYFSPDLTSSRKHCRQN
jgi:hypothetical protein